MSEVYPSDDALLNIESDSETGVEYIATGTSPYYLLFRKLLHRLLLAVRRGNDFRVYDEGGLNIGVKAGRFWLGNEPVNYEGSSGNSLADDKSSIYIYVDSAGNLVTDEYSSFPDMSENAHIRLAVVKTAAGDIESIEDARRGHNFVVPYGAGGVKGTIESHTSDDVLEQLESGSVHTNLGATGTVTLTLPSSASAGTQFVFSVQAGQELRVEPGSAAILDDSGQGSGKYKSADAVGSCLGLVSDSDGNWITVSKNGTWTEEA